MISGALSRRKCVTSPERHGAVSKRRHGLVTAFPSERERVQQQSESQLRLPDWRNQPGGLENGVLRGGGRDVR